MLNPGLSVPEEMQTTNLGCKWKCKNAFISLVQRNLDKIATGEVTQRIGRNHSL